MSVSASSSAWLVAIGLPVADVAVELGGRPGGTKMHEAKPIGNAPPDVLCPFDVPVHHYGKHAAGEMARVIPACELDLLGKLGVLALCTRRVGVAAVGADQPVHHQLER
jgi:hypothetical protein